MPPKLKSQGSIGLTHFRTYNDQPRPLCLVLKPEKLSFLAIISPICLRLAVHIGLTIPHRARNIPTCNQADFLMTTYAPCPNPADNIPSETTTKCKYTHHTLHHPT